jgi:hypothetical protein
MRAVKFPRNKKNSDSWVSECENYIIIRADYNKSSERWVLYRLSVSDGSWVAISSHPSKLVAAKEAQKHWSIFGALFV